MNKVTWVSVSFEKEGIHCYPAAGTDPALKEVDYLANPHRHIFKFVVKCTVNHNDRDIEFIKLKHECLALFNDNVININSHSCEDLCDMVYEKIYTMHPNRSFFISCYEDGENGAEVYYNL